MTLGDHAHLRIADVCDGAGGILRRCTELGLLADVDELVLLRLAHACGSAVARFTRGLHTSKKAEAP